MIENYENVAKFCRKLLCRYDEPTINEYKEAVTTAQNINDSLFLK